MKPFRFLCLPLILLFVFNSIFAQTTPNPADAAAEKEKARREQEKQQEVEKKAVAMLGEIAAEADTLKLAVNRVSVFSSLGVLLWKYDEKQARNLVNIAVQEIINAQNADDDQQSDASQFAWQILESRRQLVQSLAQHDAEFALQIFRRTRAPEIAALMQSPKNIFPNGNDYNRLQNEINTEQMLINEIARQDPKRAIKLAREILEKGVSYALLDLIERIREKEPEEAARLADEVLRKFQDMDFSVSHNERSLAVNFISRLSQRNESSGAEKSKFVVNENSLRALAEKIAVFFLRDPQSENYAYLIPTFIPIIEKLSPSHANQLRRRENEIKQKQAQTNPYERLNQINRDADAETLLKEAQNAPSELKNQYYSYAANKLISDDNTERARAVINSIPDRRTREYALQNLNSNLFYKAINAGNIAEARRLAAQAINKNQMIAFYIQISNYARRKEDDKLARQILDEAASLIASNPENSNEMSALFQLANAYAGVAPETSLTLIEATVGKFNELLNASILLSRFGGNETNRPDEITAQFFHSTLSQYGFYFNQNDFPKLAAASFERTKSLGDGFQRTEARIFTRLMIAQSILSQIRSNNNAVYNLPISGISGRNQGLYVLNTDR
ncbi:MAG TPA: hypothetical protein VF604_14625 [Pyrinomonadaceae bacterium]|jgi:uncharacterized protein with FMN-binding domain